MIKLSFQVFFTKPVQVAAAPWGSATIQCGLRSTRPSPMPTAPLRTPSWALIQVSVRVATALPTSSPRNVTSPRRAYFSQVTTSRSAACMTSLIACSQALASCPRCCSTALMSLTICLISSHASPSMMSMTS
ncbi:hypothetical protein A5713_06100 [Mycobacterium sp. E2497]|nr:hypothetical protein A9X04_07090 [Mycobacterium sp. E3247]OBI11793.1 hypothetical protein A5713_06100 [Mycobacterium sp. E2497]